MEYCLPVQTALPRTAGSCFRRNDISYDPGNCHPAVIPAKLVPYKAGSRNPVKHHKPRIMALPSVCSQSAKKRNAERPWARTFMPKVCMTAMIEANNETW